MRPGIRREKLSGPRWHASGASRAPCTAQTTDAVRQWVADSVARQDAWLARSDDERDRLERMRAEIRRCPQCP